MAKAKKNEKILTNEITKLGIILNGSKTYQDQNIISSIDQTILVGNNEVLIEVDSYNMSKVVVGQYVLINSILRNTNNNNNNNKKIFIIIHFYKKFNPSRTEKHLEYINNNSLANKGIPYKAYTFDDFIKICVDEIKTTKLVQRLFKEVIIP